MSKGKVKRKHDLESAFRERQSDAAAPTKRVQQEQVDDTEEVLDLSEEANMSYNALLLSSKGRRSSGVHNAVASPGRRDQPAAADKIPEYPSNSPFDEDEYSNALTLTKQAFHVSGKQGWRCAIEHAVKLELSRAKQAFGQASQTFQRMDYYGQGLLLHDGELDRILEQAKNEPIRTLPNPKNKELQQRSEQLKRLVEQYESELEDWTAVETSLLKVPAPQQQKINEEIFPQEEEDEELLTKLVAAADAPKAIVRALKSAKKRVLKIKAEVEEAERESASLVSSYAAATDEDAKDSKMLIQTMTSSSSMAAAVVVPSSSPPGLTSTRKKRT